MMSNSVGEQLRAAREARAWSVEDVAVRLKVPARYVAALESGDDASLPEPTFVRGYIKAYAKSVGLDPEVLLASSVPLEVRAPRPLIGPEGHAKASRRAGAQARVPSFRNHARRLPLLAVILAAVAAGVWFFVVSQPDAASVVTVVPEQAVPVTALQQAPATGVDASGVTLAVPLPGVLPPSAPAPAAAAAAVIPAAPVVSASPAVPSSTPQDPGSTVQGAAQSAAATPVSPAAPRKGLHARFNGTCWVEVRDTDNVVIHTRIAMAGNELNVDGKAPLTVTLGDASAAELWYNGERVAADRFSSNGIARIIVGQAPR
jgi:cytoskeleton protein RodZ